MLSAESRKLDHLEQAVLAQPATGAGPYLQIRGARALLDLAVRAIVRAEGTVRCVTAGTRIEALAPAFRARLAAGRDTSLWAVGPFTSDFPVPVDPIDPERLRAVGGPDAILLLADGALAGKLADEAEGIWSESPLYVGLVAAAISHVVGALSTEQLTDHRIVSIISAYAYKAACRAKAGFSGDHSPRRGG